MKYRKKPPLGATGTFPRGKLKNDDEGGIAIGVLIKDKTVIIDFGKPISWVGMDANQAIQLATVIKEKAELCQKQ